MRCLPTTSTIVLLSFLAIPPVLAADGPAVAADVRQLMQARDYAAAVAAMDEALKQEETPSDELAYLKGRALALAKRYDEAATVLLVIGQQSPESPWARKGRFAAAAALVSKGDFARAQAIYRAEAESLFSLERKQEVAGIYLEFANSLFDPPKESDEPDYAQAQELYRKALDLGLLPEKRMEVELRIARCLLEQGGPALLEGACAAYAAFLDAHPESAHDLEARFRLGECLVARKEYAKARQAWRELLTRHAAADSPRIAEVEFRLAETWRIPRPESLRDLMQGVAELRRFVERYPDHELAAKAHLRIAQSYAHRGKHAEAIEALTPFLADPRYETAEEIAEARNLLGQAYRERKQYDDAIAAWQAFLVAHPANPEWSAVQKAIVDTEYARAREAYEAERYDEAIQRWNAFLARYPLDDRGARVLFFLGAIDAKQQRWDAAVAAWRRVASKYPESEEARQAQLSVAVTLEEKLGRMDEALDEYRKLAESQSYEQEVAQAQGAVLRMTSPSLTLTTKRVFRGNEKPSVRLSTRNIKSVSVRVYRVDLEAYFRKMHATDGIDTLDIGLIAPDATFLYKVPEYAKYRRFDNDVELPLPEGQTAGVLAVTVSSKTQEATTLVLQSDLDIIVKSSREGLFVFAQNMATGKPWPEARLLLSDGRKVWAEATTDQQGVFQGTFDELKTADHLQILATAGAHMAASGLDIENVQPPPAPCDLGYLATDRSVYRPGDEVRVRGVPRHVKDGTFHFESGAAYSLEVYDPNDRRLWHESVVLGDLGTFHARVPLPALCAAGEYLLKVEDSQGGQFSRHFTVEPLERKPIRLEVDLPRTTFYRGEPVEGTVRAMTSYGVPLVRSKITYRLADEIEQTATTDHRGEVRFQLPTDEFVESQWLVLSANLAEDGAQTEVTLFLSAEDFGLTLETTRGVYMAGETFQVDVLARDANKQPVGRPFVLSVLKRDAKTTSETLVEKHELESDAAGKASQPLKLEAGGDYLLRAEVVDRFGNAILAEHRIWVSDASDDVRLRVLADTDETTAGGTLAATVLWHEAPALALVTCEGETVLDYRLVPLETGANRIEVPVGAELVPNFRLAVAVMTGAGAASSDTEVEHRLFMADAAFEVRRELAVDLAVARADGTTIAEGLYRPGESLEVTVTTTDALGKPLSAEVGLALVDGWFRPQGDPALLVPQNVLRPPRRALAMQTGTSVEFRYEPGTRPIGVWPADDGDDSESEEEEAPREFIHWASNRGRAPESLEALMAPPRGSSQTQPQPMGSGFFQFGFGANRDDPFAGSSKPASASFTEEQRSQTVQVFQPEERRLSTADIEFADTGYWNPTVRTGEDGKATVTIALPPQRALWQLVAEAVAADTLTGAAERSITAETDLAVELRVPESFTEGDRATIPVVVYNEAIAEGPIALTLKTTILGQTIEEKQTLPVKGKGRLDARLPVTIALPAGTAVAPPWFEAVFELTVTAGERTAVVRRSVPVLPLGVPMHGTAGGMATGSKAIRASHPADAVAARRSMQLLVSPTLERALLDMVLPPAESAASLRPFHTPASPLETAADALMAAAAMRALVTPENNPGDARALDRHVQTVMGQLVASQQDAGSWSWTGQRGDADLLATARAAWALSLAKQAGFSIHEPTLDAALDALQAGIADSDETDYDRRAVLLHAMAAAGNGNFSLVNRLHRDRAQLSPTALAYLALTFVEMDRNDTAAEVLALLQDQDLDKEPAEPQAASHRSHSSVELRAICLLVLLKIAPDSPQIETRAEWLLSQRSSARWQAGGAMGPAVVALARWHAKRAGQDKPAGQVERAEKAQPFSLALVVNGRELRRLELAANGPTQVVNVPADLLAGEFTEVRFLTDARATDAGATDAGATYAWQCLLDGYIPLDNAKAATGAQVVQKVCQPAPRMLDGRELPRGFGIVAGNYKRFTNPITQLPVEHRALVELYVRRLSGSDAAASRPEYCVITDPIPAGTQVVEQSITGPIERFEVTPAGIVFHLVHSDRVAAIRYELVAEAEGTYQAGPALLRHANRGGGLLSAGGSLKLEVLSRGEASTDPYRFTPEELYALGKHHFGKKEYAEAEKHLRELVDQWNVRPQVYRDAIQMLLDAYLAIGPVAKMVDTFEIVITRWPETEITFDQLLKIGVAYQEIGEFERGYLVYRGAVEGNLTREGAVAGFLETQDELVRSIDFMERLLGEYPPEDYAASTLYSLAQHVHAKAANAADNAKLRQAGVDGEDLVRRSTAMLERFLTEYPENPSADRAAFSVANALLDVEKYEEAIAACARYAERYPKSSLLDSYWYIQGYCQFALGRHDEAAGMLRKVSEYQWTDPKTGRTQESTNKWRAVFLLGQIFHSQGQPADAIKQYRRVEDRFADARRSIAYFLRQQIALPELTTLKPGEPAELKLTYRNVPACDVKVYGIDLMKFARLRGNLAGIEQVNLAGIRPRHEETVALAEGLHAADQTHALSLPLAETGAYLVVCRGGNEYASGLVLVTPLQIKVEHVATENAARVMVRDAAADQVVSGAQVNVIDSTTGRSIVGKTDLRGVFVAEEVAGPPTVIVKDEPARYGLHQAPAAAMHAGGRPLAWVQVAPPREAAGARFGVPLAEDKNAGIRQALAAPISLEFVETPLQDVVDYLKSAAKIEIQIDRKALDDVGVATDMPVTKNLRNVTLKSALRLMLRELGLTYNIEDEVLLITTPEEAENRLETRVYRVTDLVRFQDKQGKAWSDVDSLIELITSNVKPQTWDEVGGPGSIAPLSVGGEEVITLSQTEDVHEELEELLARLRQVGKLPEDGTLPVREPQQWDGAQAAGFGGLGGMGGFGGGMGGFGGAQSDAVPSAPILQPGAGGKAELLRGLMEAQRELQGAEADQLQQMYEKGKGISGMGGGMF